ncbi:MAG: DUF3570 domain-containing protein [Cellvibrionaceae bacterium]
MTSPLFRGLEKALLAKSSACTLDIDRARPHRVGVALWLLCIVVMATAHNGHAAVLPEDRVDVLYHSYDGGGAEISGPSVLVRKGVANTVSVYANYYVDEVTGASIDVDLVAGATTYQEERTEYSLGLDYLYDKTIMSLSYSSSTENDYEAETVSFGISQDFFGDLTNVSLGFSLGNDTVRRNEDLDPGDTPFEDEAEHRRYSVGISQILTKSFILALNFETVVDEGYLSNPYRQVRFVDNSVARGFSLEPELYPRTRNSDAYGIRGMYYLPYRASLRAEYRALSDSWGISADSVELRYIHPIEQLNLTLEGKYRVYDQTEANFFDDLFPFRNVNGVEFRARDKEMSAFTTDTIGLGISYELPPNWIPFMEKSSINLYWDHIQFDYEQFRDHRDPEALEAGAEEFYSFNANVIRFFFSFWY